jgi:hypothetical protein
LLRGFLAPGLPLGLVRFVAEAFLFVLLTASLLRGQPFSLPYAHAVAADKSRPAFLRVNMVISGVWAAGFAAMAAMDGLILLVATLPLWPAIAVSVASLAIAITVTLRYPVRAARR